MIEPDKMKGSEDPTTELDGDDADLAGGNGVAPTSDTLRQTKGTGNSLRNKGIATLPSEFNCAGRMMTTVIVDLLNDEMTTEGLNAIIAKLDKNVMSMQESLHHTHLFRRRVSSTPTIRVCTCLSRSTPLPTCSPRNSSLSTCSPRNSSLSTCSPRNSSLSTCSLATAHSPHAPLATAHSPHAPLATAHSPHAPLATAHSPHAPSQQLTLH
ncbi:hypothetical protein BLNAU_24424 [Blattamonas nauphoetae]|uniref:Uncharacterized protein n=1 Tax=Blattamonas nauphoetae TaxID=2049346 RepID=A0ABQ9WMG2_9EUKA|nr:hypothetical protein BLNAU_24424 [Blattamonas nauphoetae]